MQRGYLNSKAKRIEKEIISLEKKEVLQLKNKKENIQLKIEEVKNKEKIKRKTSIEKLKKELEYSNKKRKEENKDLNFVGRLRKEFKGIPIVTLVDDIAEGAAGIEKVQTMVQNNLKDPYGFLILAQSINYYKKAFLIMNLAKSPIDPIGTAMDISSEFGGEYIEESFDKDKWTYKRALLKSINLGLKSGVKDEKNLVCIGRSAQLLSMYAKDPLEKENFGMMGKKYLEEALKVTSPECKDEILFYLGRIERKKVRAFKYSLNNNISKAVFKGTINALKNQSKKVLDTSERIMDKTLENLLKNS